MKKLCNFVTPIRKKGRSEKLLLRYFEPYFIEEKISEVNYKIRKGEGPNAKKDVVHISRILPYHDPWTPGRIEGPEEEEKYNRELEAENRKTANQSQIYLLDFHTWGQNGEVAMEALHSRIPRFM